MSEETIGWLNDYRHVKIGFTEKRGHAWHYRESEQGGKPNHYVGAIPVDDILKDMLDFEFIEAPVCYLVACALDEATVINEDGLPFKLVMSSEGRKGMLTSDTHEDLGSFKDGYTGHAYEEWLMKNVANILDSDLQIGSAILLRKRAVMAVQVEMPENVVTKEGVEMRPFLLATTSFDGTVATTYKLCWTWVVCDNTLAIGLSEKAAEQLKYKHTRYSKVRLANARDALGIVHTMADDISLEIERLCQMEVSRQQFNTILEGMVPLGDDPSKNKLTITDRVRSDIRSLYVSDSRVAPWTGTGLGVVQAFNTYNHHTSQTRGRTRVEKNLDAMVSGRFMTEDDKVIAMLEKVLASV